MVPCGLRRGRNKNVGRPGPPLIRISTDAGQAQCSAPVFSSPGKTNEYAPVMELVDMRDLGSRAAMRVGSSPFRRTKRERHLLKADAFLFWVPPPRGRLHPSVIEMLGANELPLRRGFAWGKTLVRRKSAAGQKAGFPVIKNIDFTASCKKEAPVLQVLLFWVPPPGRLHPPVFQMLGGSEFRLRQVRLRQNGSYGAKVPPAQSGLLCDSPLTFSVLEI